MSTIDSLLKNRLEALVRRAEQYPIDSDEVTLVGWQKAFDLIREDLERLEFIKTRCTPGRAAAGATSQYTS